MGSYLEVLEIYFDANFLCTSSPLAKQVDALASALHTEAIRGFQGFSGQRLFVQNDIFI